jgi:hypothetical protein
VRGSSPWHRMVAGQHGLGRRREGGNDDLLPSTGMSSRRGNEEMITDLDAVEEVGALGRLL